MNKNQLAYQARVDGALAQVQDDLSKGKTVGCALCRQPILTDFFTVMDEEVRRDDTTVEFRTAVVHLECGLRGRSREED